MPFTLPITFRLSGTDNEKVSVSSPGDVPDVPFAVLDEPPVFPGCADAVDKRDCFGKMMNKHIVKNFKYPVEAQEQNIQGRVSIMFVIDGQGAITGIRKRGSDPLLEDEAERIIKLLPQMVPGKHKGKAVRVPYAVPINFKLQGDAYGSAPDPGKASGTLSVSAVSKRGDGNIYASGRVSNGSKNLPGANIQVKGKTITAVTDFDGNFTIEAQKGDVLAVQYRGYPVKTVVVQ